MSSAQANQMEVDCDSAPIANQDFVDQELIPSTSRLSRLPTKVPSSPHRSQRNFDKVAIPAFQNNNNKYKSQDVHLPVINSASSTSSTATRSLGQPSTSLETTVSSSSQPTPNHVLTHPIRRPRTQIFQSPKDLAAHYGIPQRLPPAPRTNTRYLQPPSSPKQSSPLSDYQTLSANYLIMLSKEPTDSSMAAPSTPAMSSTLAPAELNAPVIPTASPGNLTNEQIAQLTDYIAASPEFRDNSTFFDYMTSPLVPELDAEFGSPPFDTPFSDFLTTPLFNDDSTFTSPSMEYADMDMPLFGGGGIDYSTEQVEEVPVVPAVVDKPPAAVDFNNLYTISPGTPALDAFDPSHLELRRTAPTSASKATPAPPPARRSKATGIRKGVTPDTLLDEDAPTQPRKYTTPSATSRKEVPAGFARKRARSVAFADEEDQLDDLPPNPTEQDLIEQKRRQNRVAARRSRKRKLEQFQRMEASRDEERGLKETWTERAQVLLGLVRSMGVNYPDFEPDQRKYADA
ncbi:hypothetical protein M413DRAFT_445835 [Hebeloma cylindrosporum]|uniref:BZIP domain-containing protein n=1 Tax=Hebeloma cylindrosporum TaxID=76867 RepID=A0A0C2XU08_HEBCY|nr:hypothetical protein M413DRAFT_445835 [Hebeloma cylindrosporum h7]